MTADSAKPSLNVVLRPTKRDDFDEIVPLLKQLWPAKPIDWKAAQDIFDRGLSADKFTVTEKYTLPDGGTMEDRAPMVRKR